MKKAVIFGNQKAGTVDAPDPKPKEDWVVVKVHASAMCTEYKRFAAGRNVDIIGHEGAGEVSAVAQPGHVGVGDRVIILPGYPCGKCEFCLSGDYSYCENRVDFAEFMGTREDDILVQKDEKNRRYGKIVCRDGRLVGANFFNMDIDGGVLQ